MDELSVTLAQFVAGVATSVAAANRLEVLLDDRYPDDELVQGIVADLACYRPGGGDLLFDTPDMQARLSRLGAYLSTRR